MPKSSIPGGVDRRTAMGLCSAIGLGGGRLPAALWSSWALWGTGVAARQGPQTPAKFT